MRHALVLALVLTSSIALGQSLRPVYYVEVPPAAEGASCDPPFFRGVYIAKSNQNLYICNDDTSTWDEIAPTSASDRTGWYILSDAMNTADEFATQIGNEVTGSGDIVRATGAIINSADLQVTTSLRAGPTEGALGWDDVNDRLLATDGASNVTFYPVEQMDTSSELAGICTDETGDGALVFNNEPTLFLRQCSGGGTDEGNICWDAALNRFKVGDGGFGLYEFSSVITECGTAQYQNGGGGCVDVIEESELNSMSELETQVGGINIITSGEINTSSEVAAILTDETGSGAAVFADDATMSNLTTSDGLFRSTSAATATAFEFRPTTARTTGDIGRFSNSAGTFQWNVNSAGNLQGKDGARVFLAYGSDESVYNDSWGQVVLRDNRTGAGSGTDAVNLRTNAQITTSSGGGVYRSVQVISEIDWTGTTASGGVLTGAYYEVNEQESTHNGNSLADIYGQRNRVQLLGDSTTTITNAYGTDVYISFLGDNTTLTKASGVHIQGNATIGTGTTVSTLNGIEIDNLHGHGTASNAIRVEVQGGASPSGAKGNITMDGDDYNEGHYSTGDYHIRGTSSSAGLWVSDGAPTSNTDGECVMGCNTSAKAGDAKWCLTATTFDTGDECCAEWGLTCEAAFDMGGSTARACTYDFNTGGEVYFLAACY